MLHHEGAVDQAALCFYLLDSRLRGNDKEDCLRIITYYDRNRITIEVVMPEVTSDI